MTQEYVNFDVERLPLCDLEEIIAGKLGMDFRLIFESYQLISVIANSSSRGSSADVVLARRRSDHNLVALKLLVTHKEKNSLKDVIREGTIFHS